MKLGESASSGWLLRALAYGGCSVAIIWILAMLLGAMLGPLKSVGQSRNCQANVVILTRGFRMYTEDYDEHFPPSQRWMDSTAFFLDDENRLHCPTVSKPKENRFGYAMNSAVSGKARKDLDPLDTTPVVYDSSNLSRHAADEFKSLPTPGRHRGRVKKGGPFQPGNNVGYAGGSATFLTDEKRPKPPASK
jgi:hypothetical protein